MTQNTTKAKSRSVDRLLSFLGSKEILKKLTWDEWLDIGPPYPNVPFKRDAVFARYERNGYDWDIHGQVYTPEKEVDPRFAFVIGFGTNGSASETFQTPDGRPGIAQRLAMQGFKVLAYTFPGHYNPPDGLWPQPIPERRPAFVLDRTLSDAEIADRCLKATMDMNVQGLGLLVDTHLAGRRLIGCNGPNMIRLPKFSQKTTVVGIASMGFGGPDSWRKEWRELYGHETEESQSFPIHQIERKSPQYFRGMGYESAEDICPWGGADEYIASVSRWRSQMKWSITVNQHAAATSLFPEYVKLTGLPREEYFGYLDEPDPKWLASLGVLLLVGENDKHHWDKEHEEHSRELFMGRKYAKHTDRSHVILVPRHGHIGGQELHNENFPHVWLWALKNVYFG